MIDLHNPVRIEPFDFAQDGLRCEAAKSKCCYERLRLRAFGATLSPNGLLYSCVKSTGSVS